jgi:hypothetical protein
MLMESWLAACWIVGLDHKRVTEKAVPMDLVRVMLLVDWKVTQTVCVLAFQ